MSVAYLASRLATRVGGSVSLLYFIIIFFFCVRHLSRNIGAAFDASPAAFAPFRLHWNGSSFRFMGRHPLSFLARPVRVPFESSRTTFREPTRTYAIHSQSLPPFVTPSPPPPEIMRAKKKRHETPSHKRSFRFQQPPARNVREKDSPPCPTRCLKIQGKPSPSQSRVESKPSQTKVGRGTSRNQG